MNKKIALIIAAVILLPSAYAYLDPGSGSMLIQIIFGSILGALFTLKMYWKKIVKYIKRLFR